MEDKVIGDCDVCGDVISIKYEPIDDQIWKPRIASCARCGIVYDMNSNRFKYDK